jgi:hypothetical protein
MSTDMIVPPAAPMPAKIFDAPLVAALQINFRLREIRRQRFPDVPAICLGPRNAWLPLFAEADTARCALFRALTTPLDHALAVQLLARLFAAHGLKGATKAAAVRSMLDAFDDDIVVRATACAGDACRNDDDCAWQPLRLTPAVLDLACKKMRGLRTFVPKVAEVRAAIHEAERMIVLRYKAAEEFCEMFLEVDRVLLQHDRAAWLQPYQKNRQLLARVLELHAIDDDKPTGDFQKLVARERQKLVPEASAPLLEPPRRRRIKRKPRRRLAAQRASDRSKSVTAVLRPTP